MFVDDLVPVEPENMFRLESTTEGIGLDPVNKVGGLSIDSGLVAASTTVSPGHDTTVDTVTGQGATRVSLARVNTLLTGADHGVINGLQEGLAQLQQADVIAELSGGSVVLMTDDLGDITELLSAVAVGQAVLTSIDPQVRRGLAGAAMGGGDDSGLVVDGSTTEVEVNTGVLEGHLEGKNKTMLKITLVVAMVALGAQAGQIRPTMPKRPLGYPADKIVGGSEVEPNSIPYQVSIQYPSTDFHFCGGAIYDESTVITAAHCCAGQSASDMRVNAGEHSLSNNDGTEQLRDVSKIIGHGSYGIPGRFSNDICLLKLSEPLNLDGMVDAAKLPAQGEEYGSDNTLIVSGWGTLSAGGISPDALHSVVVPFVPDGVCRGNYYLEIIDKTMMCAGKEGVDSCQGDSGGPLTCDGVHCGVVSWGYGCAGLGQPGVYAKTSYFVDWIQANA
eukprot:maker-scaffold531_size145796-snap-gene-0.21 protein:Tk12609 transcript:maker-scaffold531_size145796-snap-gene-0.21-mRNA-1 annotation:"Trypsin-1"